MAVSIYGDALTIVTWATRLNMIGLFLNTWISSPCISNLSVSVCGRVSVASSHCAARTSDRVGILLMAAQAAQAHTAGLAV